MSTSSAGRPKIVGTTGRGGSRIAALSNRLQPAPRLLRAMGIAAQVAFVIFVGLIGSELNTALGPFVDFMIGVGLGLALLGLAWLVTILVRVVVSAALNHFGKGVMVALLAFFLLLAAFAGGPPLVALLLAAAVTLAAALIGFGLGSLGNASGRQSRARALAWGPLLTGFVAVGSLVAWALHPGSSAHVIDLPEPPPALFAAEDDPLQIGPYGVRYVTYGSGTDRWRHEYAAGAELTTRSVDGTPFVKNVADWQAAARATYWGFGFDDLPLNARVWYPDGEGTFPLVLIVHGNHNMMHFSDAGYAWLGEHLASRGFVVASIDQNFLNGAPIIGSLGGENDARGWLLLEHLRLWQEWHEAESGPFAGIVDLDNIALIGHSRGGEAAAIAAAFNRLSFYPDDARVAFDYGFAIRAVVAIAPSDGQYRPAGRPTPLEDVSYLVLQGGHDSDVFHFAGDRQYQRATFAEASDAFKASVYIHEANHGQFNTDWGRLDQVRPWAWLLNTAPIMRADAQRQAGKVFITAFVEETLRAAGDYRLILRDHRAAGVWLPAATYVTRYQDATFSVISNFEEDVDVTTATLPGARAAAENLALWREQDIGLRGTPTRQNNAVLLGWRHEADSEQDPSYRIELPEDAGVASEGSVLAFDMAATTEDVPLPEDAAASESKRNADMDRSHPIDFTLALKDAGGNEATVAMADFRPLLPALPVQFTKLGLFDRQRYRSPTEPLLQTFEIPLASFRDANHGFQPEALASIEFRFDQTPVGAVLLADVGLADQP